MKQQLAEYVYHINPVESQEILSTAISLNPQVIRPLSGVSYSKLDSPVGSQAQRVLDCVNSFCGVPADLIISVNGLLDDLVWGEQKTKLFEEAVKDMGLLLGFASTRPEKTLGIGPDNLWAMGELKYFVIECKSGVTTGLIAKKDCDQLGGSVSWFRSKYDDTCKAIPVMIHPSKVVATDAFPTEGTVIIDVEKLDLLKDSIRAFCKALASGVTWPDVAFVAKQLEHFNLTPSRFVEIFTVTYKRK